MAFDPWWVSVTAIVLGKMLQFKAAGRGGVWGPRGGHSESQHLCRSDSVKASVSVGQMQRGGPPSQPPALFLKALGVMGSSQNCKAVPKSSAKVGREWTRTTVVSQGKQMSWRPTGWVHPTGGMCVCCLITLSLVPALLLPGTELHPAPYGLVVSQHQ